MLQVVAIEEGGWVDSDAILPQLNVTVVGHGFGIAATVQLQVNSNLFSNHVILSYDVVVSVEDSHCEACSTLKPKDKVIVEQ